MQKRTRFGLDPSLGSFFKLQQPSRSGKARCGDCGEACAACRAALSKTERPFGDDDGDDGDNRSRVLLLLSLAIV